MTAESPQHVVFIDSRVPDIQDLLNGVQPGDLVYVLDPSKDGIQQIADVLAANNLGSLSTISIVSHGAAGEVTLGATMLTDANLAAHSAALAEIGAALGSGGTLQLFGCDVGQGAAGQQFVNDLAAFAGGVNVAAATHDVGSASLGGSWTLDVTAGPAASIPSSSGGGASQSNSASATVPFTEQALSAYQNVLVNPVQTQLWITATGGGAATELIHVDDNGGATSINDTTVWGPTSANRPTQVIQIADVALDTANQTYFIVQDNNGTGNGNVIWQGSLAQELANPSGTPTLTSIFSQTGSVGSTGLITGIALDATNQQVYFTNRHSIVRENYDGTGLTTLATGGANVFADGLALDVAHNQAFFFSTTTFSTTSGGVPVTSVTSNAIYVDSNLGSTSVVTPTRLTLSPGDPNIPGGNDFPASLGLITGIAVDTITEKLYFTTEPVTDFSLTTGTGGVYEYDLTGNPSHTYHAIWVEPSDSSLFLTYIHVDDATNSYYVTDVNDTTGGGIYRGSLSGGAPTLFTSIAPGTTAIVPEGFDFDNAPTLSVTPTSSTFSESASNPAATNNPPVSVVSSAAVSDDNALELGANVTLGGLFVGDVLGAATTGTDITQSYNSSTGVLTLTGVDTLAHYQSVLASVTFTSTNDNPTDYGSDTSRTLSFQINDGLLTSVPQTVTVTVAGVNDAPTLAGTGNASFTEGGSAVTLSSAASVSDPDNLTLAGATVAITGGTFAGDSDVLSANVSGTAITASYNAATETLVLSGSDTLAHYQQVLDSVTFVTASANPDDFGSAPTRTVTWTLDDGSGSNATSSVTTTVSITAMNDAPTLAGTANASFTENGPAATLSPAASVSDPDSLTLAGATVHIVGGTFANDGDVLTTSTIGTAITASYNSATETLTLSGFDTLANYQIVLDKVTFASTSANPDDFGAAPTRTVTWTLDDGSGSNNLSAVATTTIGITAVNDAPALAGTTNASFTENGPATTLSPAASVADPDSLTLADATVALTGGTFAGAGDVLAANVSGTAITASYNAATETLVLLGNDTLAHYQQVLDSVTFVTASENPDDFGSAPTRTVTWTLDDGSASNATSSVTTTVSITAVDDAPTLAGTTNASFAENGPAVTLSGAVSISDPDSLTLAGASVAITGGAFPGDNDVLAANVSGTAITASYNAATETLTLTGTDTFAHYQQVLDSVTFASIGDNPDDFGAAPTRTVAWTLNDGNATGSATSTVSIAAVNDTPTLAGTANASYTENGSPVTLSGSAAVTDPDNLNLASATVAVTGGTFAGDGDVLSASVSGTAITASYNAATETLVLSGSDTLAHYQQVLDSVAFASASDNPDDFGLAPTRTVTWTLNDGSASNATTSATSTVSITAVNDAPTLSNVAASASYIEQAAATTLSGSLAVSDPDGLTLANATVRITAGTFAGDGDVLAANVSGTSITASYDSATETLVLSGVDTVAHYQSVLDSVTFFDAVDNPTNYGANATRTVTWTVTDGSASNNASAPQSTTLNVTAVNDAPTLTGVPSTASYRTGQTVTLAPAASVSDPDNLTLANATVQVTGGTFVGDTDVLAANVSGTGITASYNAATETLTLTGSDTLAHYQQVLDSVTFTSGANPTNFGLNPTRTVTWTVNDGSGSNNNATTTSTISVSNTLVKNDFNGDGRSDIVFQDNTGAHAPLQYLMNGTTVTAQATLPNPGSGWHIIGSGDFNSDGRADIVWQNANGTPMIWTMNGSTVTSMTTLADPGASWKLIGTGDFNGDAQSDIVFQNTDGTPMIWTMNGTSVASTATLSDPGSTWGLVGTGDFNGDGKSDLVFQLPNGTPMIWEMNGTSVISAVTLPTPQGAGSWPLIGTGDFDGDGHADLLFQKTNGTPMIWEMNGTSIVSTATLASPGANWQLIGTGDYNGDGKSDILFQNNDGTPMIWTMNGTTVTASATLPNPGILLHANTG